jgi:hypothetical protein
MTVKPLKSIYRYIGSREREILRNAIMDGETLVCEVATPYRNKLNLISNAIIETLNGQQTKIPNAEPAKVKAKG